MDNDIELMWSLVIYALSSKNKKQAIWKMNPRNYNFSNFHGKIILTFVSPGSLRHTMAHESI